MLTDQVRWLHSAATFISRLIFACLRYRSCDNVNPYKAAVCVSKTVFVFLHK